MTHASCHPERSEGSAFGLFPRPLRTKNRTQLLCSEIHRMKLLQIFYVQTDNFAELFEITDLGLQTLAFKHGFQILLDEFIHLSSLPVPNTDSFNESSM